MDEALNVDEVYHGLHGTAGMRAATFKQASICASQSSGKSRWRWECDVG